MKTTKNFTFLLTLLCLSKNIDAQNKPVQPTIKLTIQTVEIDTKKPIAGVQITLVRNDSLKAIANNDENGTITFKSTDSNFIAPNFNYQIILFYPIPVKCNNNIYACQYKNDFSTMGIDKNTNSIQVYKAQSIDLTVLNFDIYTMYFEQNKINMNAEGKNALYQLVKTLKQYPNFEITLAYNETGLIANNETKFERLEKLVDILMKKGVSIKRISTSIKFVGKNDIIKYDNCAVALSGYDYNR